MSFFSNIKDLFQADRAINRFSTLLFFIAVLCALNLGCSNLMQKEEMESTPAQTNDNVASDSPNVLAELRTIEPTSTPKPTAIPKDEFLGTWRSCGVTSENGKYYTVEQLEDAENYNITDIYYFLSDSDATGYIQGEIYNGVSWHTTADGVVVGSNEMILDNGKLAWSYNNEVCWFERVSDINSVDDIVKNPYVGATLGQKNALKKAASYLSYSSFSYSGLIKQLEYEQFTHEEAVYAADNCGADWNEQAVKKAQSYLSYSSFSKNGLISQLEYEGFTHEEAVYAVEQVGY